MENRKKIAILVLIIGIFLYIYSFLVRFESNISAQNITKMITFILATILSLGAIVILIIKTKELPEKNLDIQKKDSEENVYCKTCGAEISDKTGEYCSKCGAPLK